MTQSRRADAREALRAFLVAEFPDPAKQVRASKLVARYVYAAVLEDRARRPDPDDYEAGLFDRLGEPLATIWERFDNLLDRL